MNQAAFDVFVAARRAYLVANGWVERPDGEWQEPRDRQRRLDFKHAVNSQFFYDLEEAGRPPYIKPTPAEQCARSLALIKAEWPDRHGPRTFLGSRRQAIRGHIRWYARELGEAGAVTRVQKARLVRALHAKHHRERDCACGKKGPPY